MINYIGIDGEMSGTEIESGHKLIQIGMAKYVDERVVSIGVMLNPGAMQWSDQAEEVHQFSRDYIEKMGEDPAMVDQMLAEWANPTKHRRDYVMVGFNVGSFDKPFIKQQLPITYGKFSRRCVDLNSIIFSMSDTNTEFERIKERAKDYAFKKMDGMFEGFSNRQHDAEYDAVMSLYCFEYLRNVIKK
jgi:DNA polymerase III epsilon subunit-like protein